MPRGGQRPHADLVFNTLCSPSNRASWELPLSLRGILDATSRRWIIEVTLTKYVEKPTSMHQEGVAWKGPGNAEMETLKEGEKRLRYGRKVRSG